MLLCEKTSLYAQVLCFVFGARELGNERRFNASVPIRISIPALARHIRPSGVDAAAAVGWVERLRDPTTALHVGSREDARPNLPFVNRPDAHNTRKSLPAARPKCP